MPGSDLEYSKVCFPGDPLEEEEEVQVTPEGEAASFFIFRRSWSSGVLQEEAEELEETDLR